MSSRPRIGKKNTSAAVKSFAEAAAFGEVVVLAVGGAVALDALGLVGADNIAGKIVIGARQMVNPHFAGGKPTMFICGNDQAAKKTVEGLLDQFGWETADMGAVEAARAIEPLCMLWRLPGIARNDWSPHAFKLLR